jgi:hypothetical protein
MTGTSHNGTKKCLFLILSCLHWDSVGWILDWCLVLVTYRFKFLPLYLKHWQMATDIKLVHIQQVQPFVWQTLQTLSVYQYGNNKIKHIPSPRSLKDNIQNICTASRQLFYSIFVIFNFFKWNISLCCCTPYAAEFCLLGCDGMWSGNYVWPFQRSLLLPFSGQSSTLMVQVAGFMKLHYLQDYMLSVLICNENRISVSHIFF